MSRCSNGCWDPVWDSLTHESPSHVIQARARPWRYIDGRITSVSIPGIGNVIIKTVKLNSNLLFIS